MTTNSESVKLKLVRGRALLVVTINGNQLVVLVVFLCTRILLSIET